MNIYPISFHRFIFLFNPSFSDPLAHLITFRQRRPKHSHCVLLGFGRQLCDLQSQSLARDLHGNMRAARVFIGVVRFMLPAPISPVLLQWDRNTIGNIGIDWLCIIVVVYTGDRLALSLYIFPSRSLFRFWFLYPVLFVADFCLSLVTFWLPSSFLLSPVHSLTFSSSFCSFSLFSFHLGSIWFDKDTCERDWDIFINNQYSCNICVTRSVALTGCRLSSFVRRHLGLRPLITPPWKCKMTLEVALAYVHCDYRCSITTKQQQYPLNAKFKVAIVSMIPLGKRFISIKVILHYFILFWSSLPPQLIPKHSRSSKSSRGGDVVLGRNT